MTDQSFNVENDMLEVAVVGMSCRFPGANNTYEYWENLKNGVESITILKEADLEKSHVDPAVYQAPNYVKAASLLDGPDQFDANFFGFSPKEAAIMDPQHRLFLEVAWEALENAGYDVESFPGTVGIFAGASFNTYLINCLLNGRRSEADANGFFLQVANDKDNLATRTAYKLNLKGPSVTVQSACSTSLVAIHLACQSLLSFECDATLAGGVAVRVPQKSGYLYQEEMILSDDGHCRPFDKNARGTIFGSGAGVVVLKRLADAIADGDHVDAIIKGSAINNDGADKIGFTAPGRRGQEEVIARALALADVPPDSIGAVETHGTGTILGDPLEFEALTRVFGSQMKQKSVCAIGSVKSNFGHLECAAGIASFIKMVLSLKNKWLAPSLNFREPNPHIDLDNSSFYVNTRSQPWERLNGAPLRGGVSSFGVGGTNAHVVLEEVPEPDESGPSRIVQCLTLSAKTADALETISRNLARHFKQHHSIGLPDAAHTLRVGRRPLDFRRVVVCRDREEAIAALETSDSKKVWTSYTKKKDPGIVFMFPGQGTQYVGMAYEVYQQESVFKQEIDRCAGILQPHINADIRDVMFPGEDDLENASARLTQTVYAQPALFVIEYALAKLFFSWGIKPRAMIGHSIGEYVAACLSGVFSLEEALYAVSRRSQLMEGMPKGLMCAVTLSEKEIKPLLPDELSIASVNAPGLTVVSGPGKDIRRFKKNLAKEGTECRLLHTSHAFHSKMMEPIAQSFLSEMKKITLNPPKISYISNVTGTWVTGKQTTNPHYWVDQVLHTVEFSSGIHELLKEPGQVFAEMGPGETLSHLVKNHDNKVNTVPSLPKAKEKRSALAAVIACLGRFWLLGVKPDWKAFQGIEQRRRLSLPTYPFERKRYWIEPSYAKGGYGNLSEIFTGLSENVEARVSPPADLKDNYLAPRNQWEKQIVPVFERVLGIARVGVKDNFFELGGHSLLATQLLAEVNKLFGTKIRLRNFFKDANPAGLAQLVEQSGVNKKEKAEKVEELPQVTVDLESRYEPFPLTEMQQAQWLGRLGVFNMSNVAAHVYFETEKQGVDLERLNKAWQFMVKRHEMLRTVLLPDGGQRILESPPPYQIKNLDLRNETPENAGDKLLAVRDEMDHQVRPIDQWPLFEVRTTQLPGDSIRLHFSIDLLICDIGSLRMFTKEWAVVYENQGISLPELELSFRDYVLAERKIKDTELYANAGKYWDKRVTELPPAPLLPLARNPESIKKPHFKRWSMRVDKEDWDRLRTRGIQRGISPSIILLTAFAQVLANWSKSSNFCINTPIINRLPLHPQVEEIVGEFATFAPVEVNIDRETSFHKLAVKLQERNWENLENRYLHGTTILRKLAQHSGDASGAVMPVVFTSTIVHEVEGEEEFFRQFGDYVYVISQTPQVWLDHTVLEDEIGLLLSWHAVDGLFPEGLVETMWESYERFLHRLVDDEQAWNSHHRELTPGDQLELIKSFNDTAAEIPAVLLQAPFFERASQGPDEIAVIAGEEEINYGELADCSNRLAGDIRRMGVKPGQLVAVVMEKGWEQVVSVLAILQAGAAYLPVSPELPKDRMKYILESGNVEVVLTQQIFDKEPAWPEGVKLQVITKESLARLEPCRPEPDRKPGDLAYIIYTSGSTGVPKGVMISHQAAQNTILEMNRRFNIAETDRVLALSELNFDLSVYDIFGILAAGGTLVIPRSHTTRDPQYWLDLVCKHRVTLWNSVPALMEMFVEFAESHPTGTGLPLRQAWLSGDWIPIDLPTRLQALIPGIEVISLGGATEGSIWSICYPIKEVDSNWVSIPYGKPLANQQFYVVNENLEYCPVWVPGELYIGGAGVALGYFKDEEQTAKSFITHPRTGEQLYRTGDLGRYLPDGNIEFLGREDFQVKISGFRIELEEIEAALNQYPGIQSAIVNALGESREKKRLVGYIIFKEDKQVEIPEIRSFLREKLPDYMIPGDFVELEAFPLTANGKVDRKALPEPRQAKVTPREMEERSFLVDKLVSIFAGVMGVEEECVDIHGNFFAMGGDSIMGIQAISKAAKEGIEISPDQLFRNPTIFDLATVMGADYAGLIGKESFKGTVPLIPVQHWIIERCGYTASRSNRVALVRVSVPLDPELVETTFQFLVNRHDVLQLHYIEKGDSWEQEYHDSAAPAELDFVDVTGMTEEEFATTIENTRKELEDMQDLEVSPLVKLCLFHDQKDRDPHFLLTANRLIMDYRSLNIFFEDFYEVYKKLAEDKDAQLIRKSPRFKEWAAGIMNRVGAKDNWEKDKALWLLTLPGQAPHLDLGGSSILKNPGRTINRQLDKDSTKTFFRDALAIARTSPEEFLLIALTFTFIKEGKSDALYVDCEMQPPESFLKDLKMDKYPGNFDWIFPLLLKINPAAKTGETVRTLKEHIRRYHRAGESYGILNYLINEGKGDEEIRKLPRPRVKFSCSRQTREKGTIFQWIESQTSSHYRTGDDSYILDIDVIVDDEKLKTTWNFDPEVCSSTVVEELSKIFLREIQNLAQYLETCEEPVLYPGDFPVANLDSQELEKFLTAFSNS